MQPALAEPPSQQFTPLLVDVRPQQDTKVRLNSIFPCITFDIAVETELGVTYEQIREGQGRFKPQLFVEGAEIEMRSSRLSVPLDAAGNFTELRWCPMHYLAYLLEKEEALQSVPLKEGPLHFEVRYTHAGEDHRYAWEVFLQLSAPQAPQEALAVRSVHKLMEKAMISAPGIGGYFLDLDHEFLDVYLLDDADERSVRQALAKVFREDKAPAPVVRIIRPTQGSAEVDGWYREAQNIVFAMEGVYTSDYDEVMNRIQFGVVSEYTAHRARLALAKRGMPQEIINFEFAD